MKVFKYFRSKFISKTKESFLKNGYLVLESKRYNSIMSFTEIILNNYAKLRSVSNGIDNIVFSKDRAMQLFAFLKSYDAMVLNKGKLTIIYKVTNQRHRDSYIDLIRLFESEKYIFIEETNFREQFIMACKESEESTVGIFVDDMIFLREVDCDLIKKFSPLNHIVALNRGPELNYCQVLSRKNNLPEFIALSNEMLSFSWNNTSELDDWSYPIGVAGYFYDRNELLAIVNSIDFKAPNSLEGNMQVFLPFFIERTGVCYNQIACVCVHANCVQSEWENPGIGTFTIEELLCKWEKGLSIDIEKFYQQDGMKAQYQSYEFVAR
jgi:hypothetical protein